MGTALLIAVVLALLAITGMTAVVGRVVLTRMKELAPPAIQPTTIPVTHADLDVISMRFHAEVESLRFAIAEGIERTDRAEKRVQKTVAGARRLVREAGIDHPALEAEIAQLQSRDDEASGKRELPAVPEGLAPARTIRIPGGELTIGVA